MKRLLLFTFIFVVGIVAVFAVFVKVGWSEFSDTFSEKTLIDFRDFLPKDASDEAHNVTSTQTEAASFTGWKFAVVGDTEDGGPVTDAILSDIEKRLGTQEDIRFVAHLGDITSHGDASLMTTVKEQFGKLPVPTYYVPGNNDLVYDDTTQRRTLAVYNRVLGNYSTPYAVTEQNALMLFLDNSYRRIGFADEDIAWTKNTLAGNKQPYTFVFFHRPLDVPGQQLVGDDETANSRVQNTKFLQMLSDYTVSRIFNGHIHVSMQYTLSAGTQQIPVTISGGGGAAPQAILGGEDAAYYHYLIVTVPEESGATPHVQVVPVNTEQ